MNEMSLSRLYRRLRSARPHAGVDAHALADTMAHAAGSGSRVGAHHEAVVAQLAVSPAHADLARLLRALEPESALLANHVNDVHRGVVPLRQREARVVARAHPKQAHALRWISGIAASVAVAFGLWTWQGEQQARRSSDVAAAATAQPDRIFTSRDQIFASSDASPRRTARGHDELFRANFARGG